jgi:hypothetical protein
LGLKVNFHKSELFSFGQAQAMDALYAELIGCEQCKILVSCLGISIYYRGLTNAKWKHVEYILQKRLSICKENYYLLM